jgi:hypothetical protein
MFSFDEKEEKREKNERRTEIIWHQPPVPLFISK